MIKNYHKATSECELMEPVRNRYFHGKMMDVYNFELETDYFINMRRLLNRLVSGYGVVCGLDVDKSRKGQSVRVKPGMAIDKSGRAIIVPKQTRPIPLPPEVIPEPPADPEQCKDDEVYAHIVICYYECPSDPVPVTLNDCDSWGNCESGAIRERYRLEIREGPAPRPRISIQERFADVIARGKLDYAELVRWVSRDCPDCPEEDSCIPLAEICLKLGDEGTWIFDDGDVDITVRPIVYTNDLLFDLLMSLITEHSPSYQRGK